MTGKERGYIKRCW